MYSLRQSTSLDVLLFGHDANGDGVTGKVDGDWAKRISKNGAAFAAMTVTVSEMENGWYKLTLSAGHTDTLGVLVVSLSASGVKRVNLMFRVHARLPDDLAYPTVSGRGIDVDAAGGVEVTDLAAVKAKTDQLNFTNANTVNAALLTAPDLAQAAADRVWSSTVDTISAGKALEVLLALCGGVATPSGSTVAFKRRDGTTTTLTVTYGALDGQRTGSAIA